MVRAGGCLKNSAAKKETQQPLLLPKKHPVTTVLAKYTHRVIAGHMGREQTTAAMREKFWVPHIRVITDKAV